MGLFFKDISTFNDLFVHTLRDIYYAENQIKKALPKMIDKATDPQLKALFQAHLTETRGHVARLEQVFRQHGVEIEGVNCPAIDGICSSRATRSARKVHSASVTSAQARSAARRAAALTRSPRARSGR